MSQENVEIVRSIYAAWERGDFTSAEWAHPEIEYVGADGPAPGGSTGLAGMAEAFRDWLSTWEEWHVEAEEYRELDGERVLVLFHFSARGKTSGLEVGQLGTKGASLFHLRGGKVTRLVQYLDRKRGLEAAGIKAHPLRRQRDPAAVDGREFSPRLPRETATQEVSGMDGIQVPPEHYDWPTYNIKGRWISYWHQVDEVVATGAATCVEIGVGPGIIRHALARAGISVTCVDIDPGLGVERHGDILSLPCSDGEFDVVLCAQVLEHLLWQDVPRAVAEVRRTCRTHAIVSLPQTGFSAAIGVDLSLLGRRSFATRVPLRRRHSFDGQHHWEVGARGTGRREVREVLCRGFEIEREYTVPEFTYHRIYVLRAV